MTHKWPKPKEYDPYDRVPVTEIRPYINGFNACLSQCTPVKDELVNKLTQLVNKLEVIHKDSRYTSVWTNYHIHGGRYDGPTYVEELEEAKSVLAKIGE